MTIQFAKPEDVTQLVSMAYSAYRELGFDNINGCETDFDKICLHITNAVINDVVLVKRNEEDNRLLEGVLGLNYINIWWSNDPVLTNFLCYVNPKYRSFKAARNLLKAAQEYAIINRLPIVFDLFAQKDVEKKKKLLKYLKFQELGSSYVFNT